MLQPILSMTRSSYKNVIEYKEILKKISMLETNINGLRNRQQDFQNDLKKYEDEQTKTREFAQAVFSGGENQLPREVQNTLSSFLRSWKSREIEQYQYYTKKYDAELNSLNSNLIAQHKLKKQALDSMSKNPPRQEPKIFNIKLIREQLKNLPYVDSDNITLNTEPDSNSKYFTLKIPFINLSLSVNTEEQNFIEYPGIMSKNIPLPDITVEVHYYKDSDVTFSSYGVKPTVYSLKNVRDFYTSSAKVPHPHILSGTEPCLGNFSIALKESRENEDWVTFANVFRHFLSSAALGDAAGNTWFKLIPIQYRRLNRGMLRNAIINKYPDVADEIDSYTCRILKGYHKNSDQLLIDRRPFNGIRNSRPRGNNTDYDIGYAFYIHKRNTRRGFPVGIKLKEGNNTPFGEWEIHCFDQINPPTQKDLEKTLIEIFDYK